MRTSNSIIMAVQSGSAAVRLREARRFLERFEPGAEVLLLGGSRGSVDDLARAISIERGATFGLHRLSFTQLAARLARNWLLASARPRRRSDMKRLRRRYMRRLDPVFSAN